MGDYYACINGSITHYILLEFKITPQMPSTVNLGFCLPIECAAEELTDRFKDALYRY